MITRLQPVISTTGIRRILDNNGREIATVSLLLDGVDNPARLKEAEHIHNAICDSFNNFAARDAEIAELWSALKDIDGDTDTCHSCDGSGLHPDGESACGTCGGYGFNPAGDIRQHILDIRTLLARAKDATK